MPARDELNRRPLLVMSALAAVFALAPACGDSGGTSTDAASTTGTTDSTTGTTEAATTTGTDTTPTTTDSSTTGEPAVCDGSMPADVFQCQACTECGKWTTPLAGGSYPAAIVCMLEGMRDDRVVGAESETCDQGKCQIARMLTSGAGTLLSQQMILDQNTQMMDFSPIQELPFKEAAYFETCLAAYDETCASPNSWFTGASVDVTSLVCP